MQKLTKNAQIVLKKRYLLKNSRGNLTESPEQMFKRVAKAIAKNKKQEQRFFEMMSKLEFLPNSPTLMNAGTRIGQLSACFVLPVNDSLKSIFEGIKEMALIHQSGGGTGFDFSRLRPRGDVVKSTKGVASGPVSFIKAYDSSTDVIKQGGKRRGANMGVLRIDHPDIVEFVMAKEKEGELKNFNLSVAVTDKFMDAVKKGQSFWLVNPSSKKKVKKVNARKLFDLIIKQAWKTGDPGLIFIDRINKKNPTPALGRIEAVNPCGEQPLLSYESCNLGSINLSKFVVNGNVDWDSLRKTVGLGVEFLNNVIDKNKWVLPEIRKITLKNKKIGLGVMGFADMLIMLGIKYDSEKAVKLAEKIMKFISDEAHKKSKELGKGKFRNKTVTTIAPTGSISTIAGCSSGIEPIFAVQYKRNIMGGMTETKRMYHTADKKLLRTAHKIKPKWHVRMQAAFQKFTDNAVSKTVNIPRRAKVSDVKKVYLLAYRSGCKGITIYRYGSKREQVFYLGNIY